MDRKGVIILLVSFVLLLTWYPLVDKYLYPVDERKTVPTATNEVTHVPEVRPLLDNSTVPPPPVLQQAPDVAETPFVVTPLGEEEIEFLETDEARFHITSHGGGIKLIELKEFPGATECRGEPDVTAGEFATLNTKAPVPALSLLGLGLKENGGYTLTRTADGIAAESQLENGLFIRKQYTPGTNYLITANLSIENRTDQPIKLPAYQWVIGTATPMNVEDNGMYTGLQYNNGKVVRVMETWFQNRTLGCFPGRPRLEYVSEDRPIEWAAVDNQFFTIAVIPAEPAPLLASTRIELPPPPNEVLVKNPKAIAKPVGLQTTFVFPKPQVIQPQQALTNRFDVFAGPKEYKTLAKLSSTYETNLDEIMNFGKVFGFFAKGLLLSMNGLNGMGLSYGLSIVVITIIIKLLFWPLTQASTRSMKRMGALQPQMKALQEKYKDDPQKMNRKLMEFMRENKVNPLGGCLPILLQLPVFIGFYSMLRSAIELRGESFLWTCDLSKADTLFIIPGLEIPFNLWPLLMGAAQFWQASMTPMSPGMDPMQQKIMKYMPLMFVFILYNFSAGLALYWTVQNLLTIVQMKLTKSEPVAAAAAVAPAAPKPALPPQGKKKNKRKR